MIPVVENNDFYVFDDALEGAFIDEEQAAIVLPFEFNEHHQDECQVCMLYNDLCMLDFYLHFFKTSFCFRFVEWLKGLM